MVKSGIVAYCILFVVIFMFFIVGCQKDYPGKEYDLKSQIVLEDTQNNLETKMDEEKTEPVLEQINGEENMESDTKEIIVLETSKGIIELSLDRPNAPVTVENFLRYVKEGHYDGTIFHRVIKNFMIQGGGFEPSGNQKNVHEPIKLESNNGLHNVRGTVAMARTNVPDSATSQFFINVVDNSFLDYSAGNPGYAVFGTVVSGMDVVDAIREVLTESRGPHQDWPVEDVLIEKAYVKK